MAGNHLLFVSSSVAVSLLLTVIIVAYFPCTESKPSMNSLWAVKCLREMPNTTLLTIVRLCQVMDAASTN